MTPTCPQRAPRHCPAALAIAALICGCDTLVEYGGGTVTLRIEEEEGIAGGEWTFPVPEDQVVLTLGLDSDPDRTDSVSVCLEATLDPPYTLPCGVALDQASVSASVSATRFGEADLRWLSVDAFQGADANGDQSGHLDFDVFLPGFSDFPDSNRYTARLESWSEGSAESNDMEGSTRGDLDCSDTGSLRSLPGDRRYTLAVAWELEPTPIRVERTARPPPPPSPGSGLFEM